MNKPRKIKTGVRGELAESLLFSYLSQTNPSRGSVAKECKVSRVTSGKIAEVLLNSGLMMERYFALDKCSPCNHLVFKDNVNLLLIDLSSHVYKMSIIGANGEVKVSFSYNYDSSISDADNLNIFLSRNGLKIKQKGISWLSIAVLFSDDLQREYLQTSSTQAMLPSIDSKDVIDEAIFSVFHKSPSSHLNVSQAILSALKFKALGENYVNGISYLYVGSHLSAFHVYGNGSVAVCSPQNLISIGNTDPSRLDQYQKEELLIKLINFMDCAFSPNAIIIESCDYEPSDRSASRINKAIARPHRHLPAIYTKDSDNSLCNYGIARQTLFDYIRKHIN